MVFYVKKAIKKKLYVEKLAKMRHCYQSSIRPTLNLYMIMTLSIHVHVYLYVCLSKTEYPKRDSV